MKKLALAIACTAGLAVGFAGIVGPVSDIAHAQGMNDAGPAPATTPDVPTIDTPDPIAHPGDALSAEKVALKAGWLYGVLFGLLMVAKMIQSRSSPGTWLGDKLGTGRAATAVASATTVMTAVLAGLTHQVPWGVVIIVAVPAIVMVIDPHTKKPALKAV